MARRYEIITELYRKTVAGLAAPQVWQSFLTTACHNFRLPFDEQVLLYAQRPDATAVLPIEGKNGWNKRFGRWVNGGATGIGVFDGDAVGRSRLKYYFDISDTHESRFARPVPIWTMRPEYEPAVIEALENSFGELADKTDLAAALLSAAKNAVEDNMPDYLTELKYYKENSFLEELDDLNALNEKVKAQGGEVIGINTETLDGNQQGIDAAKKLLAATGASYRNIYFASGSDAGKFALNIMAFPTTYVFDRDGNVVGQPLLGGIDKEENLAALQKNIDAALAKDNAK